MSLVQALVLVHLSATSLLLVLFTVVVVCQRTGDLLRSRRLARHPLAEAYPDEVRTGGASVLEWTVDLREPVRSDRGQVLQQTS